MKFKAFCNTEIVFENLDKLKLRLLSLNAINIVLIMTESSSLRMDMNSFINELQDKCSFKKGSLTWIKNIHPNPTPLDIENSINQIGNRQIDAIVAIGGGSVIDLAKSISAFHNKVNNKNNLLKMIKKAIKNKECQSGKLTDIIAIPTTAGTGSEVTQWATIWDENNEFKFSIDDPRLKPRLAVIVPELTVYMPSKLTLSTGLDAMCQSIEAYWSKHTTPLIQEIAYRAIEIITHNLRKAVEYPDNLKIRENVSKASVLSGIAFSQTRTTACHSISYPLTMLHDIPHGFAAAITLDGVSKLNEGNFPNDKVLLDLFKNYGGIMGFIDQACLDIIDMRLSSFGVTKKDIVTIVNKSFTLGRMNNNPVNLSEKDVELILKNIL